MGAILATAGVYFSISQNIGARDWRQITGSANLGGSVIYANSVLFARAIPFLIGFGIAVGLMQARTRRRQSDILTENETGSVKRHELSVVIMHWLIFGGMLILWFTAVLMLPGVLFEWAEKLLGAERLAELENTLKVARPISLATLYTLHYIGSAVVLFVCFNHLALHLVAGDRGLIPKKGDIGQTLAIMFGYLGIYGPEGAVLKIPLPQGLRNILARGLLTIFGIRLRPAGKYLATERLASYWPAFILIGTVVVTGIIKGIHYLYPIPSTWRQSLTILHDVAGILLVVWLVLHVAAIVIVPGHWPLLRSMFTTRVTKKYVEDHHPLWAEELKRKEQVGE